jgi:hypothetical protein
VKFLAAIVALPLVLDSAPGPIGVATASGTFLVEGAPVRGNATLFEGARVETRGVRSELRLPHGVRLQLAENSAARVWRHQVQVSRGMARILGPRGVLTSVSAGQSWSFALQQSLTRSGCLVYKAPGFLLQVEDSGEVLEITGNNLAAGVGNRVQVTGVLSGAASAIAPASQVLNASSVALRSTGGCLTVAAALNAQTSVPATQPAGASTGTAPPPSVARGDGLSAGAKVAIVGAVAGGGAAAALALSGKKDSTSP